MNHTYRSIWCDKRKTYVAAPEITKLAGKKSSPRTGRVAAASRIAGPAFAGWLLLFGANALAELPAGGVVSAGNASITTGASNLTVNQSSQNVAINWDSFSIGLGDAVTFVQPNASAVALNRVLGPDPSSILGSLLANGKVFLVNPNGVLFGKGASVNVGGLVASTMNISDADFMAGRYAFGPSGGTGTILNQGSINAADGGYVALLGANVSNEGVISARFGTVALAAGEAITLDVAGDGLLNVAVDTGRVRAMVENGGLIQAPGGQVLMTAQAAGQLLNTVVNNTGVIEAQTVENRNGTIRLLGDMQGGTVNVGGTLDASAPNGGDGGFVETSAASVYVADGTVVTTLAPGGTTGTWLIDPNDYVIAPSGGNITGAQLSTNLGSGNVLIQTTASGTGGNGDIFVNDSVSWSSNYALALTAYRDISVNGTVGWTGTATNGWRAGRDVLVNNTVSWLNNAKLDLYASRDIAFNASVIGNPGQMSLTAGGNITQTAPISVGGGPYGITSINMNGTGDVLLDNTGNNLQNVYVSGGAYNVRIYSIYSGGAPLINLPTGGTSQLGDVSIRYPNSTGLSVSSTSYYSPFALQGNLSLTSGGSITQSTNPFQLSDPSKSTTIVAGGDVTLNTSSPNANRLNAVTVTAPTTALVTLFNDSSNASLTLVNPVSSLILTQRNANIALAANSVTGTMTLDVRGGTLTNNTVNLGAQTLSDKLVVYAEGGITQSGPLSVASGTELQASAGVGDIILDNAGNNLNMVYVSQGRDLSLRSTYTGDANFGLPNAFGGLRNVSIVYGNASSVGLSSSNGPTQLTGTLTVTSGGSLNETSGVFELTDPTKNATFTAGGDVTLDVVDNLLNGVTITAPSTASVVVKNSSTTAALTLVNPVTGLDLYQPNSSITLPANRVTGTLNLDTTGGTPGTAITLGAQNLANSLSVYADGVVTQTGAWSGGAEGLGFSVQGSGITLGYDILAGSGTSVGITGPVTLTNDLTIQGGEGVALSGGVDGARNLTLRATNAAVGIYDPVGGVTPLSSLQISAPSIYMFGVHATNQAYFTNNFGPQDNLSGSGTIQIAPFDAASSIGVMNAIGTMVLQPTQLDRIQPGFQTIVIGRADGTGELVFGDGAGPGNGYTFNADVVFRNKGRLVNAINYGITVQDVISATSGHDITLVTENVFRNYRGSDALAVSGGGYWRVYSTNPDLDTRGGLAFDFKQYDTAYGDTILGTGNGLIYTRAPSVTATLTGTVSKQYDGTRTANLLASNYTSIGGAIDGDTIHVNAASTGLYDTKDVGTSKNITVSGADSYTVTNGTKPVYGYRVTPTTAAVGSITKAPLTVTALDDTKQYDAIPYSGGNGVDFNGFVNGETSAVLGGTLTYGGTSQGAVNVGDYWIIPGGLTSNNYALTYINGVLSIVERPLTPISGSLVGSVTRPYTGTTVATLTPANYQLTGWVGSDGATVTETVGTYSQANVGSNLLVTVALTRSDYSPTGSTDLLNYSLPTSISGNVGSITQAPLTITASNFSRTYNGLAYSGGNGVAYSGFVNGETSTVLGGTLAYGGTSQGAKNAGSYVITPSGLTSSNYAISFANGALNITQAPLTITASDFSRMYNGLAYSGGNGVTYSGFVNSETSAVLGGSLTYGGTSQGAKNAGSYVIAPAGLTSGNYAISFANGALNISQAPLTITASDFSRMYNGLAYSGGNGVTYSGFVNSETSAVLGGSLAYGGTSQGAKNVGSYVITPAGLTSGNYAISYASGALNITQAPLSITAKDFSRIYNGLAYSGGNGVIYSGFVNGETSTVLGGTLAYGGTSQGAKNVGSYVITPSGLTSGNYAISFTNGALSITQAPLTVTARDFMRTYNGLAYSGGNGVIYTGFVNGETSSVLGGTLAYGGTSQGAINAGPYVITPSGLTSSNYAITFLNGGLDILQAPLTVQANPFSRMYNGLAYNGGNGVTYTGFVNGETSAVLGGTLSYGGSAQGAANAGSYEIVPQGLTGTNYEIVFQPGALTISKAPLSVTARDDTRVYDGTQYSGGNGVTYSGFVNGETSSALGGTITYGGTSQGAAAVGTYTIIPGGLTSNNYALTFIDGVLTISARPLVVITGNLAGSVSRVYDGTTVATLVPGNFLLTGWVGSDGATVTETVGTYDNPNVGDNKQVTVSLTPSDYSPTGTTDLSNYSLPSTITGDVGRITAAPLNVTANDFGRTYNGLAYSGGNGVVYSGFVHGETSSVLGGSLTYGGSSQGATNAGGYAITPQGLTAQNYAINFVNGQLTIGKAPLTVTANGFSRLYTGLAYSGGNGVTYGGFVNGETSAVLGGSLSYAGTSQGATNVGSYVITPQGLTAGNYAISYANGALTISKAPLTVTAVNDGRTYDGTAYSGGNGVTYSGFVNGETNAVLGGALSYAGTSQGAKNAGAYVITPEGLTAGNYTISYADGALTISSRPITVQADDRSRTYGAANPTTGTVTVTNGSLVGTDVLGTATLSSTATATTAAGTTAPLTPSAQTFTSGLAGNYNVSYANGTLTITQAPLTVTAVNDGRTYDGTAYSGGNGVAYSGFVNGETSSVLGGSLAYAGTSQGATNAGSYVITPQGLTAGNYAITFANGSLVISPRPITVRADNLSRVYGNANPTSGTVTLTSGSLVGSDALGTASLSSTATSTTAAGTAAPLTPSAQTFTSGLAGNYSVTYANGTLTITQRPITVQANDLSRYYGYANPASGTVTLTGGTLANNDVLGTATLSSTATGTAAAGQTAPLTPSAQTFATGSAGNYSITYNNGTLTITQAPLTVTAANDGRTYDGAAYSGGNGVTYAGFMNGETSAVLGGTLSYGGTSQGAVNAGTYAITPQGLTAGNYAITFANGALTISPAPLTVAASDGSKVFDGVAYSGGNGVTYSGFVNGETSSVLGGTLAYGGSSQGAVDAGSYVITPQGLTAGNYTITYANGALTITQRPITVQANDQSRMYGAANPTSGTVTLTGGSLATGDELGTATLSSTATATTSAGQTAPLTPSTQTFTTGKAGNYAISYVDGVLTITPAPLTVTANDDERTYDGQPYFGGNGVTYSGFVNGETESVLGGTLGYGGTSQGATAIGDYVITPQGLTAGNYTITFQDGALVITAPQSSAATDAVASAVSMVSSVFQEGDRIEADVPGVRESVDAAAGELASLDLTIVDHGINLPREVLSQ